jgi:flagellar protein FliO/FliZ
MSVHEYLKFFAALLFVLGLMGGLSLLLRRFSSGHGFVATDKRRLKILEILPLDARRRAVLIARDDQEHLVILGAGSETVVERNIAAAKKNGEAHV